MKKRALSFLLTLVMVLSLIPTVAMADESNSQENGNDNATEQPVEPAQEKTLQARINALPTAEELAAMDADEQETVYAEVSAIYEALDELSEEELAEVDPTPLEAAAAFFNQQIMPLEEPEALVAGKAIYVSQDGNDEAGNGSLSTPYASLAKAVKEAPGGATIYVLSDLTVDKCSQVVSKHLTITSIDPEKPVTIKRADYVDTQNDRRGWYNPAMIEVLTWYETDATNAASLTLRNIILDDQGHHGAKDSSEKFDGQYADNPDNRTEVQDAMIAAYSVAKDSRYTSIVLDVGAVLKNYGGWSAITVNEGSSLVMKAGSMICDDPSMSRPNSRGAIAVNHDKEPKSGEDETTELDIQAGAIIQNMTGRAIYMDGPYANGTIDGTIRNITASATMAQNYKYKTAATGTAIYLRGGAEMTLNSSCTIERIFKGNAVSVTGTESNLVMNLGAKIRDLGQDVTGIFEYGTGECSVYMDGEITGIKSANAININSDAGPTTPGALRCVIGPNGTISNNVIRNGAIYIQTVGGSLDIYGSIINNDTDTDTSAGGVYMAHNQGYSTVTMYPGAKICNNAGKKGGGVLVSKGTFIMEGGVISGNIAHADYDGYGGGIYVRNDSTFIMNGGEISENYSKQFGGGIAYDCGDNTVVSLKGGKISENYMNCNITTATKEINYEDNTGKATSKEVTVFSASGGENNDISVSKAKYGKLDRYLQIKEDPEVSIVDGVEKVTNGVTIGNPNVYMVADTKYVTPANDDFKLGNASTDAQTSLQKASASKGWGAPLQSLWCSDPDRVTHFQLNIPTGDQVKNGLPFYALVIPTGEAGLPATDAIVQAYATNEASGKLDVAFPSLAVNGYAVAIVQPTLDYGSVVITGPNKITENKMAETYEVPYIATYKMSQNLANVINQGKEAINNQTCKFTFVVELDSRLTAKTGTGDYAFTSPIFDVDTVTESGSTLTVTCKLKDKWTDHINELTTTPMTLTGTGVLDAKDFAAGDTLATTGNIQVTVTISTIPDSNIYIYIPANSCLTEMAGLVEYTITASAGSNGAISPSGSVSVTEGSSQTFSITPDSGYRISDVKVDGKSIGTVSTYTFKDVQGIHTISASFEKNIPETVSLNYNANQGGDTEQTETYTYIRGDSATVKENMFSRNGYTFKGWNTAADGTGTAYQPGDSIPMMADSTLYAQWKKNSSGGGHSGGSTILNTEDHYSYIVGYQDGTLQPYGDITRGQVATIFFRLLTDEARDKYWCQTNNYSDCGPDLWCNNAISTLSNMGIIDGYTDGTFRPNGKITRAQFAKMAVGFFETTTQEYQGYYSDVSEDAWYTDYVEAASRVGLIQGFQDGTFRPDANITRAQACVIVNRALNRKPDEDHLLPEKEMITWTDNNPGDWFYADMQEATNSHDYTWLSKGSEKKYMEDWTKKLEQRDWAAFEHAWSTAHSAPGGEVVK